MPIDFGTKDWVENYKLWIRDGKITDAPGIFLDISALQVLSATVKKNAFIYFRNHKIYPSLWTILIGKDYITRKSTCLDLASKFIREGNKDFILPNEWSSASFVGILSMFSQGVIVVDEFISLLDFFQKSYASTVKNTILELYDREMDYSRYAGGGKIQIKNPFLNIFAASTLANLQQCIITTDVKSGFMAKFMLVDAQKRDFSFFGLTSGDENDKGSLFRYLYAISTITHLPLVLSKDAQKLFDNYCMAVEKLIGKRGDDTVPFLARLVIYVLKIAMLYHYANALEFESDKISVKTLLKSIYLLEKIRVGQDRIIRSLAFTPFGLNRQKVLEILEQAGDKGTLPSKISKKLQLSKPQLLTILESLEYEGTITIGPNKKVNKLPDKIIRLSPNYYDD